MQTNRLRIFSVLALVLILLGSAASTPVRAAPAAVYLVNSTDDPGTGTCDVTECTLREAIAAANASAGTDTINFAMPVSTPPYVILPAADLPAITEPVILDGTSQPDFAGAPVVWIDGTNVANGLTISGGGTTIRGLIVSGAVDNNLLLSGGSGSTIVGNYLGIDDAGNPYGNPPTSNYTGVYLSDSSNNTIGGVTAADRNIISGQYDGVYVTGTSTGNRVVGNYIGTDPAGTVNVKNEEGVSLNQGSVTVAGNLIAFNTNAFAGSPSGTITAYANTVTGFTSAVTGSDTNNLKHNWWGQFTTKPASLPQTDWDARLSAPISAWSEGAGSTVLGSASLSGGVGTAVIVSHGRGLANAPFGNGVAPYVNQLCSDFYDFFTVGGSGTWQVQVTVDNTPAGCDLTLVQQKLFSIPTGTDYSAHCIAPHNTDKTCWSLLMGVTNPAGRLLQKTGLTVTDLGGTQFVAGDINGGDPTAVELTGFTAHGPGRSIVLTATFLLGALALVSVIVISKQRR